jgi:hypothetical protein
MLTIAMSLVTVVPPDGDVASEKVDEVVDGVSGDVMLTIVSSGVTSTAVSSSKGLVDAMLPVVVACFLLLLACCCCCCCCCQKGISLRRYIQDGSAKGETAGGGGVVDGGEMSMRGEFV